MPVKTTEIIELLCTLAEEERLRVTIRESVKGGLIAGVMAAAGGFIAGPIGLAIGGVIGSCIAAAASQNKFTPAVEVIATMQPEKRDILAQNVRRIMASINVTDVTVFAAMIAGDLAVRSKVKKYTTCPRRVFIILNINGKSTNRRNEVQFAAEGGRNLKSFFLVSILAECSVHELLNRVFPARWIGCGGPIPWSPRSPDITPLDVFLWGYVKNIVHQIPVSDISILKERIQLEILSVTPQMLKNTWREIENRLNILRAMKGVHVQLR